MKSIKPKGEQYNEILSSVTLLWDQKSSWHIVLLCFIDYCNYA